MMLFYGQLNAMKFLLLASFFGSSIAIIGSDLLLTPKQGLQLNGKSIYYKEEPTAPSAPSAAGHAPRNQPTTNTSAGVGAAAAALVRRPWERTLKHVTYVTLFTNEAISGNLSQLRSYEDFLNAPYIADQSIAETPRFGDIVTLASGRLEQLSATGEDKFKNFRFAEGACNYGCDLTHVWALWQVRKIRHREVSATGKRKFRYEMKFSVTPLKPVASSVTTGASVDDARGADGRAGLQKRRVHAEGNIRQETRLQQNFIQKEDDYPQSFGRIVYNDERDDTFAERRYDGAAMPNRTHGLTPMPQSTFAHGIFQPPMPVKHNIGEYYKGDVGYQQQQQQQQLQPHLPQFMPATKPIAPKIELFPNIFNLGSLANMFLSPTTFRPNYQQKFARPETYRGPQQYRLPQHPPPQPPQRYLPHAGHIDDIPVGNGLGVTHHFHHHYYMSPNSQEEHGTNTVTSNYHSLDLATPTATPFYSSYFAPAQKLVFPTTPTTTSKAALSDHLEDDEIVVQVTPVPLRKPQIYSGDGGSDPLRNKYKINKVPPLLIYAGASENNEATPELHDEEGAYQHTINRHKQRPFVQSEQMNEPHYHYSEPDPLYESGKVAELQPPSGADSSYDLDPLLHTKRKQETVRETHDTAAPPTEIVSSTIETNEVQNTYETAATPATTTPSVDSAAEQSPQSSQKQTNIINSTEMTTIISSSNSTTPMSTPAQLTRTSSTTTTTTTPATIAYFGGNSNFISTSTNTPPLRTLSRYRSSYKRITAGSSTTTTTSTTTTSTSTSTEPTSNKWKPRRKLNVTTAAADNKARSSARHEAKIAPPATRSTIKTTKATAATSAATSTTMTTAPRLHATVDVAGTRFPAAGATPSTNNNNNNNSSSSTNGKQTGDEIYEVLTQKSVSKSVSIKVGNNGEEIPIAIDDNENEVKKDQ